MQDVSLIAQADRRTLEVFEMWIWRSMERISWTDEMTDVEVLRKVNNGR